MEKGTKIVIGLVAGAAIIGTGIYLYNENKKAEQAALDLLKGAVDTTKTESPKETVETDKAIVEKAKVAYEKIKAAGGSIAFSKLMSDIKAREAARKADAEKVVPTDELVAEKRVQFTPNKKPLSDAAWNNFKLAVKKVEKSNGRKSDIGKIISGESKRMTPSMAKERYQKYVTVPEHYAVIKFMDIYTVKKKESDTLKAMGKQQGDLAISTFKKLGIY